MSHLRKNKTFIVTFCYNKIWCKKAFSNKGKSIQTMPKIAQNESESSDDEVPLVVTRKKSKNKKLPEASGTAVKDKVSKRKKSTTRNFVKRTCARKHGTTQLSDPELESYEKILQKPVPREPEEESVSQTDVPDVSVPAEPVKNKVFELYPALISYIRRVVTCK